MSNKYCVEATTGEHPNGQDPKLRDKLSLNVNSEIYGLLKKPCDELRALLLQKTNLSVLRERTPRVFMVAKKAGLTSEVATLWSRILYATLWLGQISFGVLLGLSFVEFGVPIWATAACVASMISLVPLSLVTLKNLIESADVNVYPFQRRLEKMVKTNLSAQVPNGVFWVIVVSVLGYFALWPLIETSENAVVGTVLILMYVIFLLYNIHPWYYNSQVLLNSLITVFPYVVQTVDTYAFALREQLMEEETDIGQSGDECEAANAKAEKLERLHKNFSLIRKVQFLDRSIDSPLSAETRLQVSLAGSGILSLVTIVYSAENETRESKTARVVIGILMSLIFWSYMVNILWSQVASSRRWEAVTREHFNGPLISLKATKMYGFPTLKDFHYYLHNMHDLRGTIMFGLRVDHHRVSQLISLVASATIVSIGYGVRSLL
eukprot:g10596.t1